MKGDINVDFVMAVILFVSVYAMLYMLLPAATISFKKTPDPLWTASHYFADVLMTSPGIPPNWGTVGELQRLGLAFGDNITSYSNILDAKKIGAIQGQTCSLLKSKTDTLLDFSIAVNFVNASTNVSNPLGDGWSYRKAVTIDNTANNNSLTDYQVLVTNPVYNETGLVGSWHFDEGYGNYTSDSSGNGNDGTFSGTIIGDFEYNTDGFGFDCGGLPTFAYVPGKVGTSGLKLWSTGGDGLACAFKSFGSPIVAGYTVWFYGKGYVRAGFWNGSTMVSYLEDVDAKCNTGNGNTDIYTSCNGGNAYSDWKLFKLVAYADSIGWASFFGYNKGNVGEANSGYYDYITNGTTWADGKFGTGLRFDGNDDYLSVVHSSSLEPASVSASAWVRLNSDGNRHIIAAKWAGYTLEVDSGGYPYFMIANGTNQVGIAASTPVSWNTWNHIVGTYDDSSKAIKIYINGAEAGSSTIVGSISYGQNVLRISNTLYSSGAVNGSIDEVRIYNRSLSPSEIQELYQAKAKLNYADMRFTANDGSTLLNHWKEADGKFWVRVPTIPSSNTTTIYAYYGNPSANSTSNGNTTFLAFDDFNNENIDSSIWNVLSGNGAISEANGKINFNYNGVEDNNWWTGGKPEKALKLSRLPSGDFHAQVKLLNYNPGDLTHAGLTVYQDDTHAYFWGRYRTDGYLNKYVLEKVGGGNLASYDSTTLPMYLAVRKNGTTYSFYWSTDGSLWTQAGSTYSDVTFNNIVLMGKEWGTGSANDLNFSMDNFLARKYSPIEPTVYIGTSQTGGGVGNNCNYKKRLNFTNAWNNENLVNFPALVKLNSSRINYSSTGATDMRFYDSDGSTLLSKETELWNSSGDSYIWVKVPQINANTNTDYIYAYYGCSDVNPDDKNSVWDSGYKLVQHLAESTGPIYDSTSNGNNGTLSGTVYNSTGRIDGARTYPGQGDYIYSSGLSNYNFTDGITVEAWAYARNVSSSGVASIVNIGPQGGPYWWFYIGGLSSTAGTFKVEYSSTCSNFVDATQTSQIIPWSTWNHLVVTHNFTTGYLTYYLNGAQVSNTTWSNVCAFKKAAYIGSYAGASGYSMNGSLDEVRVSSVSRSVKWVNATYLTEMDNFIAYEGEQIGGWTADNCGYRKKINFTNSWNAENLTNFPTLVKLNSNRIDYSKTSQSDIRFYDADGTTLLPKETELWNSSGDSYVWVKVPQINANSNMDYIYAYYSCANTNADDKNNVWDSNFKMVQHLKETSGSTVYDSTTYANNGTAYNGVTLNAVGSIDGADEFDGNNDHINVTISNGLNLTNAVTLEAWVYLKSYNSGGRKIVGKGYSYSMQIYDSGSPYDQVWFETYGAGGWWDTGISVPLNQWAYVVNTYGGGDGTDNYKRVYINGTLRNSVSQTGAFSTSAYNPIIGTPLTDTFDGTIDEVRISGIPRGAAWINASYLSESDNFASYGSEEGVGVTNRVGNNCNYRKKLGFNNYWDQESLTNFPVLVKLNSSRIDYSKTGPQDIRFYDSNAVVLLPKETEKWNSSGDSYIWVKVPQVDAGTNADYIYAYYGCSNDNQDSKNSVWDSNFRMVQHLSETSGTHYDSTTYGANGTPYGGVVQGNLSGKIDGGNVQDGEDDYVLIPSGPVMLTGNFTLEAWAQYRGINTGGGNPQTVIGSTIDCGGPSITEDWSTLAFYIPIDSVSAIYPTTIANIKDKWMHFVYVKENNTIKAYVNGALNGSQTHNNISIMNLTSSTWRIGYHGGCSGTVKPFNGTLDEIRISNISRTAGWVNATYLSENDNFIAYGTEETSTSTQNNCNYRKRINITNSWNPESLTDFPLLIRLTSSKIDYSKTNATDIRFYDDNAITLLPKETEKWNSSGDSYVWVKVPRINANSNSDYIYAYYGCTNSNSDDKNNVWDSSFRMVHHLSESGGTHYDSSSYANNGTINGSTQNASGKIDGADQFDGINNYVQINDGFSLNSNQITFSAWVNLNGSNYAHSVVGSWNSTNGYNLIMTMYPQTGWIYFYIRGTDGSVHGAYTTSCPTNQWVQITETYNGSVMKIYLNGAERPEATTSTSFTISTFITAPRIGETEYSPDRQYFKGTIDEVRVSNVTKNAAWINASYLSETDSFTSFGSEQDLRNTNLVGNDCNYREKFTFNNLWNPENLTNFPTLVKLSPARIDYAKTSATDIRFYDADTTTLLPKEMELWNSNGDSYIWVKIPQIDAGTNADYIYAYYGCSNTNLDDKYSVWNPNYKMVHHLEENSGAVYDSAVYGFNGTAYGGTTQNAVGKIDGSYDFDGSNDYVSTGSPSTPDGLTVSLWVKARNLTTGYPKLSLIANSLIGLDPNGRIWSWLLTDKEGWHSMGSTTNTYSWVNEWHQIMFTYNSTTNTTKYYRDGIEVFSNTGAATGKINETVMPGVLGMENGQYFNGTIDEWKVTNVSKSIYWINASYLSENDAFINYGLEESGVSGTYSCSSTIPKKARLIERIGYLKNGTVYTPIKVKIWTW